MAIKRYSIVRVSIRLEMFVVALEKVCIYLQDRRTKGGLSVAIDAFNKAAGR